MPFDKEVERLEAENTRLNEWFVKVTQDNLHLWGALEKIHQRAMDSRKSVLQDETQWPRKQFRLIEETAKEAMNRVKDHE